jgi:hypothetical protein
LVAAYLVEDRSVAEIAADLGKSARVISRKVLALDLWARLTPAQRVERKAKTARQAGTVGLVKRGAGGQFIWTEARLADLRRLYVDQGRQPSDIAAALGCRARDVSRKASDLGFHALRSEEVRRGQQLAVLSRAWRAAAASRRVRREEAEREADRVARLSDAELIARAVAAGRVTVLKPGYARGTTRWEGHLHTSIGDKVGGFRFGRPA